MPLINVLGRIEALVSLLSIFFLRRCKMISTTDRSQNNIKNGEKKHAEHSGSSALDHIRRPYESDRKGSNAQNTVKENIHHIGSDQGEYEQEIAERNQSAEQKRGPDQGQIDRRTSRCIGKEHERQNGKHEICTHMPNIRF